MCSATPRPPASPARPHHRALGLVGGVILVDGFDPRGTDHAGADGIDTDAVGRPFLRQLAAQHDQRGLGQQPCATGVEEEGLVPLLNLSLGLALTKTRIRQHHSSCFR